MKTSPTLGTQIEKPTKPKPNFLKIDFENPDFKRILNKTQYKDMGKIIDCANISDEEKNAFVIYLEDRVLFEMSMDLNKLKGLSQLLVKLKPGDEFLKDFIIKLNDFLQKVPNHVLKCINGKEEADKSFTIGTPESCIYLQKLFEGNSIEMTDQMGYVVKQIRFINFILAKSNKKEFTSFAELLELIKLSDYKNRAD